MQVRCQQGSTAKALVKALVSQRSGGCGQVTPMPKYFPAFTHAALPTVKTLIVLINHPQHLNAATCSTSPTKFCSGNNPFQKPSDGPNTGHEQENKRQVERYDSPAKKFVIQGGLNAERSTTRNNYVRMARPSVPFVERRFVGLRKVWEYSSSSSSILPIHTYTRLSSKSGAQTIQRTGQGQHPPLILSAFSGGF